MSSMNISNVKDPSPSIVYDYGMNNSWFSRLLFYSAGVDQQLLKHCPNYDRVKYQGIGGTVLVTAVLAFVSGSYALYTVFAEESPSHATGIDYYWFFFSMIGGLLWSLIIYNLDRFIVSTSGAGDGTDAITWGEVFKAIPRFLMACLIGFVISKPLEIRIMKTEIDAQLMIEHRAEMEKRQTKARLFQEQSEVDFGKVKNELVKQKYEFEKELAKYKQDFDLAELDYRKEIDAGGGASRGRGDGPVAQAKLKVAEQRKADFAAQSERIQPKIDDLSLRIKQKEDEVDKARTQYEENYKGIESEVAKKNGLIKKIQIAHDVSPYASYLLSAMLIFIEVSPLIFKMMLSFSAIDYLTENQKRLAITRRGIVPTYDYVNDDESAKQVSKATYYENELEEIRVVGKLKIDKELTDKVQSQFSKLAVADIENNPTNYVDRMPQQQVPSKGS